MTVVVHVACCVVSFQYFNVYYLKMQLHYISSAGIWATLLMSIDDVWAAKDLKLSPLSEGNLVCDPAPFQGSSWCELGRWNRCHFKDMQLWHDASCIYHADVWNMRHGRQILQYPSSTTWSWLSRDLTVIILCGLSCITLPFLREISRRPGCFTACIDFQWKHHITITGYFSHLQSLRSWTMLACLNGFMNSFQHVNFFRAL